MYVSVPLISNENCIKPHTKYNSSDITSNMLCAGGSVFDGGPLGDSCSGKEFCTNLLFCIYLGYFSLVLYKGGFFSESAICFLDLQISKKKYSKKLS